MRNYLLTACLVALPLSANSALLERLGGLAYYDTEADLTWLQDANYAGGPMSWDSAMNWVSNLEIEGITGWHLPDANGCIGYDNCSSSQMGNMFYNVLGGVAHTSLADTHNANYDLFNIPENHRHWSSWESTSDPTNAWVFFFANGYEDGQHKTNSTGLAWAVHDGDIGAVPIPSAVWLFGSGLIGLIGIARRKKS